jgi:hypothetical protein
MLLSFALAQTPQAVHAASNPGNLTLASVGNSLVHGYQGCPLGPTYTFCDQPPGTTSQSDPFFITSSAAVSGLAVALEALPGFSANFAAGDFTVSRNTCTGSLAANAQCEIDVEFSPTAAGLRQAAVTVTDAQGDSLSINIEGTGKNLALAPPYGASPGVADNSFSFGPETVNAASLPQNFTITAGAAVTGIAVSVAPIPGLESEFTANGADFLVTNNCAALAAGATCAASVQFTPGTASVGLRSAALTATDAQGDSTTVYISGYGELNGQPGALQLNFGGASPSSAACARVNYFGFCNQPSGGISPASTTFTLQNNSAAQVTGLSVPKGSVFAQGATAPDFTVQSNSCASVLAANATCNITVAFTPTTAGLRQGAIVISDAQADAATVNLAGVGDDYNIATQLPTELSVIPGSTATFNATLTPDNVFGMNGEQVTFVCPTDLPTNTSCAVTPCPATITPGMPVSLKVVLITSSAIEVTPIPTTGCSSYGPSQAASIAAPSLEGTPPAADSTSNKTSPPLALLVFAALGAIALVIAILLITAAGSRRRVAPIVMGAGFAAAILAGCHHKSAAVTTATPTGMTDLNILGSALDANGNSLNTSRTFTVTLDVVTK